MLVKEIKQLVGVLLEKRLYKQAYTVSEIAHSLVQQSDKATFAKERSRFYTTLQDLEDARRVLAWPADKSFPTARLGRMKAMMLRRVARGCDYGTGQHRKLGNVNIAQLSFGQMWDVLQSEKDPILKVLANYVNRPVAFRAVKQLEIPDGKSDETVKNK